MTGENPRFPEPFNGDDMPFAQEERQWVRDIMDQSIEDKLAEHKDWVAHVPATAEDALPKEVLVLSALTEQEETVMITVVAYPSVPQRPKLANLAWLTGEMTGAMTVYAEDAITGVVARSDTRSEEMAMQMDRIEEIVDAEGGDIDDVRTFLDAGVRADKEMKPNEAFSQSLGANHLPISLKEMRWLAELIRTAEPMPPEELGYSRP